MLIVYTSESIWLSNAQTLVNPVNCVGVQGVGQGRRFAKRFPSHDAEYRHACRLGILRPGCPVLSVDRCILWFPVRYHWRDRVRLHDIDRGLLAMVVQWGDLSRSWAVPVLGCGPGDPPWEEVHPLMERYLTQMHGQVTIHRPKEWGNA
jgi:hypothetical protein